MNALTQFVSAHWVAISFGAAYLFVGAVSCLPKPGDPGSAGQKTYLWLYGFLNLLSNRAVEKNPRLAAVPDPTKPNL